MIMGIAKILGILNTPIVLSRHHNTLLHKGMLPVLTMYLTQAITHRTLMVVYLLRYLIIIWRTLPVQQRGR